MNDTVAAVVGAALRPFPVAVALMQLLGQELEELVGILLLGGDEVFESLLVADPETGQDISCRVAVRVFDGVEVLEHVVHGAAQAVRNLTTAAGVTVAEVEVTEDGVVQEALEDDVLVACGASIIDATKTAGLA